MVGDVGLRREIFRRDMEDMDSLPGTNSCLI
jgi:hypothetical protein